MEKIGDALADCDIAYLESLPQNYARFLLTSVNKKYFNECSLNWILSTGYIPDSDTLENLIYNIIKEKNYKYLSWLEEKNYFGFDLSSDLQKQIEKFKLQGAYHRRASKIQTYPRTQRPISEMKFANSICKKNSKYLPVIRYEELYHKEESGKHCGTFYFYEPDSTNYLDLGNCLVAANKVDAMFKLERYQNGLPYLAKNDKLIQSLSLHEFLVFLSTFFDIDSNLFSELLHISDAGYLEISEDYQEILDTDEIQNIITKVNKFFTTLLRKENDININIEAITEFEGDSEPIPYHLNMLYINMETGQYLGENVLGSYDALDEIICEMAKEQEYDTILLQREPGEKRVVTEILDVRNRKESYGAICKEKFDLPTHKTQHPTIWFSEYGFLTY
jgi:hypothetical protein